MTKTLNPWILVCLFGKDVESMDSCLLPRPLGKGVESMDPCLLPIALRQRLWVHGFLFTTYRPLWQRGCWKLRPAGLTLTLMSVVSWITMMCSNIALLNSWHLSKTWLHRHQILIWQRLNPWILVYYLGLFDKDVESMDSCLLPIDLFGKDVESMDTCLLPRPLWHTDIESMNSCLLPRPLWQRCWIHGFLFSTYRPLWQRRWIHGFLFTTYRPL